MKHYICKGGCKGMSEVEGTCQAPDCNDFQQKLIACDCEDGMHGANTEEETDNS